MNTKLSTRHVDMQVWSILFVLLQILVRVKSDPCPQAGSQCRCIRYALDGAQNQCIDWAPFYQEATAQPVGLGELQIKSFNRNKGGQPHLKELGYCKLRQPGQVQHIQLGYVAGKNVTAAVSHIYSHPHYGLVGVNSTTHAVARFGKEGHYQNDYRQYVPECHCFIRLAEVTSNGWVRVLDDWTLWMGITTRGRLGIPHKYFWQYTDAKENEVYGWPLLKLKTPRPPEKLLFQRHLDFRVVTLVHLTKMYPQGFKDFYPESYQYSQSLSAKRSTDPNKYPQARWLKTGQRHGQDAAPPDYIHHILVAVMYYLADHASVSMECTMEILNKQVGLGFVERLGEANVLSIPYDLSGYAQSWQKLSPILMNKPGNGGRFACKFIPGVPRPSSVGPAYVWMHMARTLKLKVSPPSHSHMTGQGLVVLHSTKETHSIHEEIGLTKREEVTTFPIARATNFHPLENYPAMWGNGCETKRQNSKCHKRMVDIETKIRYEDSFYDPYQNQSILPDHTQSAVFFPPLSSDKREKRQVFAALAIVTAFAVQGVVDHAGYKGIQGLEQELNDDMNTRAVANNVRFRQADTAIGNLSRQIQDLNSKVEQLSESETATVQLLLQTVKTQALEDAVLQEQISANQRTLVTLARAHLQESNLNRRQSDAQTFLLKTITAALTGTTKKFLSSGVAYSWQLKQGLLRLQAIEQQLQPVYQTNYLSIRRKLANLTCSEILGKSIVLQNRLDNLTTEIQAHLEETRNLSAKINATRPQPIVVNYIPEITNLSLHESGERMKKAFETVMEHPVKAIGDTIDTTLGFFDDIFKHPLKIILGVVLIIIFLVIVIAMIGKGCKWHRNRSEMDQAFAMLTKIGKSQHLKV